jgi:hypothetical protein
MASSSQTGTQSTQPSAPILLLRPLRVPFADTGHRIFNKLRTHTPVVFELRWCHALQRTLPAGTGRVVGC